MASIFGHAFTAVAISTTYPQKIFSWKFLFLGIMCAILPDIDVISFRLGIPYADFWGHRGFTHSFLFSLILGFSITLFFYTKDTISLKGFGYISFFTLCTAMHGICDAMTNGGLGVAFFLPWDETRYFFPWRPIQVSPIGIRNFIDRGLLILKNELFWMGIPCLIYILLLKLIKRYSTVFK